ncbi:MAG: TonB-dependent receptor [Ignavibacteriales bacterium]|nr:TonB-dependent receptor [Ignavibacteriales bacterium]
MHRLTFLALLISIPALLFAQGLKISGKVSDTKGEVIVGAQVYIQTLGIGSVTGITGEYSLTVRESDVRGQQVELTASIVGSKKKAVKIILRGEKITTNFQLEEDIFQAEAVVVTGIASKTTKSVAEVSVSRIPVADITSVQGFQGFSQLISGKVSGVNVQIASGNAGSGWNFFVRGGAGLTGSGQPLIYIDGVRIESGNISPGGLGGQQISMLSSLNPNDIENVEILKGPAAASTYGTSASNGVVLITTKSGKGTRALAGGKPYSIDYQFTFGENEQPFKYKPDFLNADTINGVLKTPGFIREHSLSITGGTPALRYFASFQNRFDEGVIGFQNYLDRNNLKASLAAVPTDNLSIKVSSSYNWSKIRRPPNDNIIYGWLLNALSYYPAYVTCAKPAIEAIKDMHYMNQFLGSANISYRPLTNLEISGNGGVEFNQYTQDQLYPYGFQYNQIFGNRYLYNRNSRTMTYDLNARYTYKDFLTDNLTFIPTIGSQVVSRLTRTQSISVQEFGSADIYDVGAAVTLNSKNDSQAERREAGIFATLPFNYDNTFFWTLGARQDYVSASGTSSPSIMYPSASLGVRLDRFGFLPADITMLKLRGAYGESGQLPNNTDGLPLMYRTVAGGAGSGIMFNMMGNPEIEPERIKEFEVGIDAEFLNMFSLELTFYRSDATKSIVRSAFAPSTGLGGYTFPYNVGSVWGQGLESLLQFNPIRGANYDLNLSLIWNYQTNEVRDLGTTTQILTGFENVIKPGLPKYQFYDYKVNGATFNADGTYKGVDVTSTYQDLEANPIPKHTGSLTVNFRFLKDFQFYAMTEWALGHHAWSYTIRRAIAAYSYMPYLMLRKNLGIAMPAIITTNNVQVDAPTYAVGTPEYVDAANKYAKMNSSYYANFIYPADLLSIREISLSYNFTDLMKEFMPVSYISGVQGGFTVRNAFKWTKFPLDPEVNTGGGDLSTSSSEFATLPQPRTYNAWLRFTF